MCIELGTAKAQPAAEYALELLPGCEKLLFFAHHKVDAPCAPVAPVCTCLHPSAPLSHSTCLHALQVMLDAMEQAAAAKGVRCLRIDGSTPASERQARVQTFQALPPGVQVCASAPLHLCTSAPLRLSCAAPLLCRLHLCAA